MKGLNYRVLSDPDVTPPSAPLVRPRKVFDFSRRALQDLEKRFSDFDLVSTWSCFYVLTLRTKWS